MLPPENASGNYVKVVQRIPVRITLDPGQAGIDRLRPGMSVEPQGPRDAMSAAGPPAAAPARPAYFATGWTGGHNPWAIALVVTMATFMEVLDTSIANVSLPHIAGNLSVSQDESTWVLTSYLVSNAIVLPISGWIASKIGRKRFYMTCVALFTVSSFLCGIAPSLGSLIFFRVLQGVGGGGLGPSEQAILADTFPPAKRGMAFAVYGMAVVLAPAIGPTLGGFITDHFTWRWIFFINVPVGLVSLMLTRRLVTRSAAHRGRQGEDRRHRLRRPRAHRGRPRLPGDRARQGPGGRLVRLAVHLGLAIIAAVALVSFVLWERKQEHPIVDVNMFKNRTFAAANVMMLTLGIALFGSTVLLPQYLQVLMGYTAQQSGMALSPGGFVVILLLPFVGMLVSRVDARYMIGFGFSDALGVAVLHDPAPLQRDRLPHRRRAARHPVDRPGVPLHPDQHAGLRRRAAGEEQRRLGDRQPVAQHGRRHRHRVRHHADRAALAVPPERAGQRAPATSTRGSPRG